MRYLLAFAVFLAPLTVSAETALSPEEFEARVTGRTLTYSSGGVAYGAEEYMEDRRVRWSYLDGDCQDGRWYVSGDRVCFVYENIADPQCWKFFSDGGRLLARFENDPAQGAFYETSRSEEPLLCLGPEVGA